mmetsp:Transcript_14830/g.25134  ORF Transcript_14830/g.25134 Transcript_14830/m.25134 type:complete len:224 (-) Transcript_14830:142-813(-)
MGWVCRNRRSNSRGDAGLSQQLSVFHRLRQVHHGFKGLAQHFGILLMILHRHGKDLDDFFRQFVRILLVQDSPKEVIARDLNIDISGKVGKGRHNHSDTTGMNNGSFLVDAYRDVLEHGAPVALNLTRCWMQLHGSNDPLNASISHNHCLDIRKVRQIDQDRKSVFLYSCATWVHLESVQNRLRNLEYLKLAEDGWIFCQYIERLVARHLNRNIPFVFGQHFE